MKLDNESWCEIREIHIFCIEDLKTNPRNKKSLNLDQDSQRNHQVNKREICEIKNNEKPKLKWKLSKIRIQN